MAGRETHIYDMHVQLGLLYLNERRDLHFSFLLHKNIYTDQQTGLSEYMVSLDTVATRTTRMSAHHNMLVPRVRSVMGQKSFCYRAPSFWNKLPTDIKALNIFNRFKVAISKWVHTLFGDHPT